MSLGARAVAGSFDVLYTRFERSVRTFLYILHGRLQPWKLLQRNASKKTPWAVLFVVLLTERLVAYYLLRHCQPRQCHFTRINRWMIRHGRKVQDNQMNLIIDVINDGFYIAMVTNIMTAQGAADWHYLHEVRRSSSIRVQADSHVVRYHHHHCNWTTRVWPHFPHHWLVDLSKWACGPSHSWQVPIGCGSRSYAFSRVARATRWRK